MKILRTLTLALTLSSALTACGNRSNTLPPVGMYPTQLPGYGQQQPLPGAITGDPLNNNALPNDVTRGQLGSIVGRVVTRSGRTLHNVAVHLESDPSIKTTSRQGSFTLMNVPVGQHNLVLSFGELTTTVQVNVVANMAVAPAQNPVQLDGEPGSDALAFANPSRQIAAFKIDQDFLNQWQVRSIDVSGGTIYASAIDVRNITKKGTVIKMNASSGEEWKNFASAWLGLRHPLNSTASGIAMNASGSLLVVDEKSGLFTVDSSGKVTTSEADSALDIAAANGTVWITSVRGLESSDDSGSSRSLVANVAASGGVGVDNQGNAYVCVQNTIVKVAPGGTATPLIRDYLNSPTDAAVDSRNGDVYVLDGGEIKRYDKEGQFIVSFGSGALDPVSIDLDEEGSLYVADFARDHRSSQIIKFEAIPVSGATAGAAAGIDLAPLGEETPADEGLEELTEEPSEDSFVAEEMATFPE
ncbi:MAG: hypothetical protein ACO1RX_00360 [Candidatus Sericytochromatia bacterium]